MHKEESRKKAEQLYIEETLTVTEIAGQLNIPAQTIYRWLSEARDKGEEFNWDEQRKVYQMSPLSLVNIYAKSFRRWVLKMQKDIDILSNAQVADAIAKHISTLKKLDPKFGYLGAILDVIQITDQYLKEHDPDLRKHMEKHWPAIQAKIKTIATQESPL